MEALTAASIACLTIYDMAKAVDRAMVIGEHQAHREKRRQIRRLSGRQTMSGNDLLPVSDALERLLAGAEVAGRRARGHRRGGRPGACCAACGCCAPSRPSMPPPWMAMPSAPKMSVNAPARLTVIGSAPAGKRYSGKMDTGEAVRIFTGAPVPDGADAILLQEDARVLADGEIEAQESVATQAPHPPRRSRLHGRRFSPARRP